MPRLTDVDKKNIEELFEQGHGYAAIGKIINRGPSSVRDYIHRIGKGKTLTTFLNNEEKDKIEKLFDAGFNYREIGQNIKRHPECVREYIHKIGKGKVLRKSITEEEKIKIDKFLKEHISYSEISRKLNIHISTLRLYLTKSGKKYDNPNLNNILTDIEKIEIRRMYKKEIKAKEIAKVLGRNAGTIRKFLYKEGLAEPKNYFKRLNEQDRAKIIELREKGNSIHSIASIMNISHVTAYNTLIKMVEYQSKKYKN